MERSNVQLTHRPDLHATKFYRWDSGGPNHGFIQVFGINQVKTGELLFGFGKRAIGINSPLTIHGVPKRSVSIPKRLA